MANLLGQNIGTNYKGILNLNTLNGNLSGTLQAVTDGDGNASPLQLSTTNVAMLADTFLGANSATTNILTLQSTTRNQLKVESGSTLEFWRSAGVESARFDANGNFLISATSASARLHVRGDGTNPIARFESNSAVQILGVNNNWITLGREGNIGPNIYVFNSTPLTPDALGFGLAFASFKTNFNDNNYDVYFSGVDYTNTTGTANHVSIKRTFAAAAGAGNYRPFNIEYTINNSGAQSGTATGIFLNATETALNGMVHNLMNLMVDNSSKARISNVGTLNLSGNIFANGYIEIGASAAYYFSGRSYITSPSDGTIALFSNSGSTFGRLQFGGTTNAFPAIKRNGAGIDFRLADDSG
jgi:hypothetical protein